MQLIKFFCLVSFFLFEFDIVQSQNLSRLKSNLFKYGSKPLGGKLKPITKYGYESLFCFGNFQGNTLKIYFYDHIL